MIACSNPFSVLSNKKIRAEPPREKAKDTKPTQRKEPKPQGKKADVKKDEGPKKESKTVSLAEATKQEEVQKALQKEQEKMEKEAKAERSKTDKHDRSGKGHIVRKEGKGVGGWDDNKVNAEIAQEVVAEETEGEVKEDKKERKQEKDKDEGKSAEELAAEAKAREDEARQRELEEKQMTLEEYREKMKGQAPPTSTFSIRTVDTSGFKGMVAKGKEKGDVKFQIGVPEKKKPVPAKKEDKKEDKKEKVQVDVGFRMDNPARQGKGKGEGKGGRGGRGRGGYQSENAPQVDDKNAFPALGKETEVEA